MNRQRVEDFQGSETILYDTVMVDIWPYTLSKTIEYTTPRVNPNVNYALWVIMMHQCDTRL